MERTRRARAGDQRTDDDPLVEALDELGGGSAFLWMVFFFTVFPTVFAGMHSNTYIFIAEIPSHWCAVPELSAANWTAEQIREVSSADSCSKYDYDYSHLAEIGFEESLKYVAEHHESVGVVGCMQYNYADDVERKSMVEEWDLVCRDAPKRATTHMALSLGKLLGSAVLGVSSDRYGRKAVYALGIVMFAIAGPASAYVPWYWAFVVLRLLTGVSFSATQFSSLTTLTEVAGNTHRQWTAIVFNCGFASGSILVAGISYLASQWRQVQVATSLPALVLLLFAWFMPESPRWLLSQGKRDKARAILEKYRGPIRHDPRDLSHGLRRSDGEAHAIGDRRAQGSLLSDQVKGLKIIFGNAELQRRAYISYFTWMSASLTYYALALNVDNISVNYYLYAVLLGVTEIPAYLLPSPILMLMGRRLASSALFAICGALLLTVLALAHQWTGAIVTASLVARFALSAAYGIFILYTSELFPTMSRNSALGTSSSMANVGSIIAPFSVDFLGILAWWAPSTLCGTLALLAAFTCLALPETRGRPLADTVEEEVADGRGIVSFAHTFKCVR
ncbi:organic cation transporter protein [Phymastichus coffea]|uniref:organic cation transporter protein n=1 Tax=Phymastichus coffea TaxID=108790 RepID=UPI00273CB951|nr:organic cation transporter protein [Phymastichus coffea]